MKRKLFFIVFLVFSVIKIFATEQQPDILVYKNETLYLETGWGHPSPLETYFIQNDINSPFRMLSTANYRGFIATWEIKKDKLYLSYIDNEESKENQLEKIFKNSNDKEIFANWFSGMIVADNFSYIKKEDKLDSLFKYYIYVKKGIIQKTERAAISELFDKEKSKNLSAPIKEMMSLNYRYISYYYRLWSKDSISYKGENAILARRRNTSPILAFYSEDNLLWPYNWENEKVFGAPHCEWKVNENKIYLTNIFLHSGTNFDGPDTVNLPLSKIFSEVTNNNDVFANWLNGIFIIQYGYEVKEDYYVKFEITENVLINVKDGVIEEEYFLGKDFNFSKREKYSDEIQKLLEQY